MENQKFIKLDVRDVLAEKKDPFDIIMAAVKELQDGQGLILHALFNPAPLHKVMERKGFDNNPEQIDSNHWKVTYSKKEV